MELKIITFLAFCCWMPAADPSDLASAKTSVVKSYGQLASAMMEDAVTSANAMVDSIREMNSNPSRDSLAKARVAWLKARKFYLPTEALRFYGSPIDDDDGPEKQINSWPLDEQAIEEIVRDEKSYPDLTSEVLSELNQVGGDKNVTCGFHALEFLLWGPDTDPNGPGNRPVTDFTTDKWAKRRQAYLGSCAELLVHDLKYVADDWKAGELGNYRAMFEESADLAVQRLVSGLCLLSGFELAESRLQVAYDSEEQEEEPSCFSDSTHLDQIHSTQGLQAFWLGKHDSLDGSKISGAGLRELVQKLDAPLALKLDAEFSQSVKLATSLPPPFDQAIRGTDDSPGRVVVHQLILSLSDVASDLRQFGKLMGFNVPMEPDESLE